MLDCGLKLRFTSPSSYKDVELISKHHKEPSSGNLIEYSFTGDDKGQCEKNAKLGGGTQLEYPENLLKAGQEDWNKWCAASCKNHTNWTSIEFAETRTFCELGFKSANDEPGRDPTSVEVYILSAKDKWVFCEAFLL